MTTELKPAFPAPARPARRAIPLLLQNGDVLSRHEFERRYEAMPEVNKAELIEGVVLMPSPVRLDVHARQQGQMIVLLGTYAIATPGVDLADNVSYAVDIENEVQPDVMLRLERGGRSRMNEKGFVVGAPELIVEIAASSVSYDLHAKKRLYRRAGVQEYAVWQVYDNRLDWFELREDEYVLIAPDADGLIRSRAFPGLWVAAESLVTGDQSKALAELQKGLTSPEHEEFIRWLTGE